MRTTTNEAKMSLIWRMVLGGLACLPLSGCIAVGYSSSGGWFLWPGGLGLLLLIAIVIFVLRRR